MLHICSFRGLQNLSIGVARRQGYFAAEGLAVELTCTTGSAAQLAGLACGEYQLIQTAPDNVITAATQPAAFGLRAAAAPSVVMVLGGSNGPLSLYARPEVTTWQELRGAVLGVDNLASGFALVLRDLLQRQGLQPGRDCQLTVAGGTDARCDALQRGVIAATMLYLPFDLRAAAGGCVLLARSTDYYAAYASLATAGIQSWLEAHGDLVTRYIAALLRALRWIYDPTQREYVQAMMRDDPALGVGPDLGLIQQAYAAFVAPASGFGRDAPLASAGLRQVIALRAASGDAPAALGEPEDYCDLRWYQLARARLDGDTRLGERQDGRQDGRQGERDETRPAPNSWDR
jgi:ABC-type nitrate/sulfonate/bicarbonate transport system substrate-binding protein